MGRTRLDWLSIGLSMLCLVGCGDGTPPLDELPLRDTLRADPAVVAALDDSARQRLAARFAAAVTDDASSDAVTERPTPAGEVASLDEARVRRAADALVAGMIAGGIARPITVEAGVATPTPLPRLEDQAATTTAALEARALEGAAGAQLRALLAASGAQRLERVVGWPTAAVAIGRTIYVNGSWLVALGSAEGGVDGPDAADGGTPRSPAVVGTGSDSTPSVAASSSPIAVVAASASFDAGTSIPPPPPPPPPPPASDGPSFWDACSAGSDSCAASSDSCDTSDGQGDSCSGTDDGSDSSCSGTDDGSADACSTPPDEGGDCRVSPGRERPGAATLAWVLAPLGFLIGRRR